jgi:hypothetical protein
MAIAQAGAATGGPSLDITQIEKQQQESFQQQLRLMQLQQKKSDQDTLVNALTSEVKADRDTKSSLGRNLA